MTNCHGDEAKIFFFKKIIFFCLIPMTISHNPTNPRNDPWNFHKNILRIDRVEKWPFFESPFWIFFCKKKIFFASSPWKLVPNYVLEWMGLNIQYYDGLQPKIRAGIINEHERRYQVSSISESSEKKNKFICSYFGRNFGSTILFRDLMTFNRRPG